MIQQRPSARLATALAIATLLFGASTLYLAQAYHRERTRNASLATPAPAAAGNLSSAPVPAGGETGAVSEHVDPAVRLAPAVESAANATPATGATSSGTRDDAQTARLRSRLEEFNDPLRRSERVADMRTAIAPMSAVVAKDANLTPYNEERLLDFLAESTVRGQHQAVQCRLTPGCDLRSNARSLARKEYEQFEQVMGEDVMRRVDAASARQRVMEFSALLPEGQSLSEASAHAMVTTFAAQRRDWIISSEPAAIFDQRLHARVAEILTEEQLALFTQQQGSMFSID